MVEQDIAEGAATRGQPESTNEIDIIMAGGATVWGGKSTVPAGNTGYSWKINSAAL